MLTLILNAIVITVALITHHSYPSQGSFLDPQSIKDKYGNEVPYGPERFKQIVEERYEISKTINTSYNDVGKMTPRERKYILDFIIAEKKKEKQFIQEQLGNKQLK